MKTVHLVLIVAAVLGVTGLKADTVNPSAGGAAADAVVVPSSPVATTEGGKTKERIHISVDYSAFFPTDSEARKNFGKLWSSVGIGRFYPERPNKWAFDWDARLLRKKRTSEALLIPLSAGVQRGLGAPRGLQPYVAARVGPYYGVIEDNTKGPDDTKIGFNANVSAGVIVKRRYVLEARYDWFSRIAGNNLSGFALTAGVKICDFSL